MRHWSGLGYLFLSAAVLLVHTTTIDGFRAAKNDDTVLGKFEAAEFVLTARAFSVEKIPGRNESRAWEGIKSATMVVEAVYKGELKVGERIVLEHVSQTGCYSTFDERDVGKKFLFYLGQRKSKVNVWYSPVCSRSSSADDAADDLLYLENVSKARGRTRISGTLSAHEAAPAENGIAIDRKLSGRKVRVIGEHETYELTTNDDGVYEIYDLPPGQYAIEPEIPRGWKIIDVMSYGSGNDRRGRGFLFEVSLKAARHAFFLFRYGADNTIRGRVLGPSGRPMEDACVTLLPAQGRVAWYFNHSNCTGQDGSFQLTEIPPGSYIVVANKDGTITSRQPFRSVYYPNAYEREQAAVIKISEGDIREKIDVYVPDVKEVIRVRGVLLSSNGVPVVAASISFATVETDKTTQGSAFARTNKTGEFEIKVLKGLKGELYGNVILDESEFKPCPEIIAQLESKGRIDWRDEQTSKVELQTEQSRNVELRLPFPSCNKTKMTSKIKVD